MSWLKLTEEDIEQARRQAEARPPMPEILTIGVSDALADESSGLVIAAPLKITADDLAAVPPQPVVAADMRVLEQHMFRLVNAARQKHLPGWLVTARLRWHEGLAAVARGHSADMLQWQYVDHVSPEGISAVERIERYGIRYLACGENIGVVYGAVSYGDGIDDIHHAFMNQPHRLTNHRGNLLNPIWTHVGVGVAVDSNGVLVATQNFISAPGTRLQER